MAADRRRRYQSAVKNELIGNSPGSLSNWGFNVSSLPEERKVCGNSSQPALSDLGGGI